VEADNAGLVLITFPPSLDSEMGRFLTQHYGVRHREQRHTFIFSYFATLWHGFTVIFPLLYRKGLRVAGPRAIADYYDARCDPELRLFPDSPTDRQQVEADQLTLSDLAFAVAAAPVVLPPNYGGPIPSFE
jgi:hypothetical protein